MIEGVRCFYRKCIPAMFGLDWVGYYYYKVVSYSLFVQHTHFAASLFVSRRKTQTYINIIIYYIGTKHNNNSLEFPFILYIRPFPRSLD